MTPLRLIAVFLTCTPGVRAADEFFDRLENTLTFSAPDTRVRARLSGTFEIESYAMQLPAPGLLYSKNETLTAPRLNVFLDAQLGSGVYFFAQMRADRGFDPGAAGGAQVRLDEYALRLTPWRDSRLNVQLGRFATIVGNWTGRHGAWSNPLITAPLPYENLTGVWDAEAARTSTALLQWSHVRAGLPAAVTAAEKNLRVPIVWGPSYATGVVVSGDIGRLRYAGEVKLGSLSSRPEAWQHGLEERHHPTASARLGYRPNQMWNVGMSASAGPYLREFAARTVAAGRGRGDYEQRVLAADVTFGWHHLQVWSEVFAARFKIPNVGDADTLSYYTEAKYKFTPQLFGAVRWNQQLFATIPHRGVATKWGQDVWRVDFAPGYRFTSHTQLKLQYSLQHGDSASRDYTRTLALQMTVRF
ncbi:MAG: hypothetical protein EXS37_11155 [Opitutus sp.]|nr:hypothetical protein [Opitutus sp.]